MEKTYTENEIREIIREELSKLFRSGKYVFEFPIQILDGRNIQTGRTTGTQIGTDTDQKISFYGVTPIVQGSAITDPSGGATVDSQSRTAINTIIDRLQAIGIIA